MRKIQATLALAALFAAPLAVLARSVSWTSCSCTMLCCLPKAHDGSMAGMADCQHRAGKSSNCIGWRCDFRQAPGGSLALPWPSFMVPSPNALALPGLAGPATITARTEFTSAWPTKDPPPPRS